MKPRKQRLDDEFKRQIEEQERFYSGNSNNFLHDFAVSMMDNYAHDSQDNSQMTNNITATASSASDNSNDHFYQ